MLQMGFVPLLFLLFGSTFAVVMTGEVFISKKSKLILFIWLIPIFALVLYFSFSEGVIERKELITNVYKDIHFSKPVKIIEFWKKSENEFFASSELTKVVVLVEQYLSENHKR